MPLSLCLRALAIKRCGTLHKTHSPIDSYSLSNVVSHALSIHSLFTLYSLSTHSLLTPYALSIQSLYSFRTCGEVYDSSPLRTLQVSITMRVSSCTTHFTTHCTTTLPLPVLLTALLTVLLTVLLAELITVPHCTSYILTVLLT